MFAIGLVSTLYRQTHISYNNNNNKRKKRKPKQVVNRWLIKDFLYIYGSNDET